MKDQVRRQLAATMRRLLHAASRRYPLGSPEPILVVAPHADDEVLGTAGLISAHVARGASVRIAVLTDNRHSHPGHPHFSPAQIGHRRQQETLAAALALGLPASAMHFLHAPDGQLDRLAPSTLAALLEDLVRLLREFRPTRVFVPYLGDGSTEHDAAHWHVRTALARTGLSPALWEYPVWAWWNPLRLARQLVRPEENYVLELGPTLPLKHRALACHATQLHPLPPWPHPALPPVLAELCTSPLEFLFHRPHP